MTKIKLFCFPYAGGSARLYKSWQKFFPPEIEIVPVEAPGRGKRYGEKPCESIEEMVNDAFNQVKDQITDGDYAFFGHSMGAVITHELTYRILDAGKPAPMHLFLTGRGAPHVPDEKDDEHIHLLPDEEFKQKLVEYGGTPEEVLANEELMKIFLPILRADFKVCDTYERIGSELKFDFGITVMVGLEEKLTEEQIQGWQEYTDQKIKINRFPGGHFFIHHHTINVVRIVAQTIFRLAEEKMGRVI